MSYSASDALSIIIPSSMCVYIDEPYMALENYRKLRGVTADEHS